jgi:hypothetical protein
MPDFITLSCPSCGGKLQVTPDLEQFACGYCGKEHIVKRGGGIVSIAPLVENIKKVQQGVDRTASELAIKRLPEEIIQAQRKLNSIPPRPILKKYDYIDETTISKFVLIILVLGLIAGLIDVLPNMDFGDLGPVAFFLLVIGFFIYLLAKNLNDIKKKPQNNQLDIDNWEANRWSEKIVELTKEIEDNKAQLKHHQDIVSNYK